MRALTFLIGLLLLPACWAASLTLYHLLNNLNPGESLFSTEALWLSGGALVFLLLCSILPAPTRTYVFGHELTHAIWAKAFRAKVSNFKVSKKGGSVTVSRNNFLITLAPYFFPIYTMIVIIIYFGLYPFIDVTHYAHWWLGLLGFTWSFHITFTIVVLAQHQPDVQVYGKLFSYVIIYLFNVLGLCLWIVIISEPTLELFVESFRLELINLWEVVRITLSHD